MLFGFTPTAPPAVAMGGMKAFGVENAGYVAVGPSVNWVPSSHGKNQQLSQVFGDLSAAWATWGMIYDPDIVDTPVWDWGP